MVWVEDTKIEPTVSTFGVKVTKFWILRNMSDKPFPMGTKLVVKGNSSVLVKSTMAPAR